MAAAKIMAAARFLVLGIIVAALLPAGREMLDDVVREFSGAKHQAVSKPASPTASVAPATTGSPRNDLGW